MTPQEAIEYLQDPLNKPMDEPIEATLKRHEEAVDMAIEALEKQIPKPMRFVGLFDEIPVMACGSCDEILGGEKAGRLSHYCKYCGQRIER